MGFVFSRDGFAEVIRQLGSRYRIYALVLKKGEGRFTDTDVVRYDYVKNFDEIELEKRSDYSFKEILLPVSGTLFYFTEDKVTEPEMDDREILVFVRSCDLHAVKRFDQIYLHNGQERDWFYERVRDRLKFVLIGCRESFDDCFCVDMHTNESTDGYVFSVEEADGEIYSDLKEEGLRELFSGNSVREEDKAPAHVETNKIFVSVPDEVPVSICKDTVWDEYDSRCIGCGRCTLVCPTCTCFTMEDIYYSDNGKVGERRRVHASCMIDGYSNVAGGGEYRKKHGERMRFKVLHKISDFKKKFGYQMCVGCGRCDMVCPEYISFSECINKVDRAIRSAEDGKEAQA